jgi:hypothetical protein
MNSVRILTPYFFTIIFNVVLSTDIRTPNDIFPQRFPIKIMCIFISPVCATYTAHLILLDFISLISDEECK